VARIDLDRFQRLNDRIGRRATDQALIATATRMERALGGADSLARFGADEFVALFESVATSATYSCAPSGCAPPCPSRSNSRGIAWY
jgi:diguanylate cyclase (GGDEF)-like protein